MKIGVDATTWQNTRGYGRFARSLLSSLVRLDEGNQYTFFIDSNESVSAIPPQVKIQMVRASKPTAVSASSGGARSVSDILRMSKALSEPGFDVLLFPTVYSYVPVISRAKKIVMIYDVIAEKYPDLTTPSRRGRAFWKVKVALGRRQADAIVTISGYSRDGIAEFFLIPPERIHVVNGASDPIFQVLDQPEWTPHLVSLGIPTSGRLITYVGGFGPHKNLSVLVAVFAKLAVSKEYSDARLVMVGEFQQEVFHTEIGEIRRQIKELGVGDLVTFTGYLPDEELVILLNRSTVLTLPSLIEGLGLPALEAAACGCPVVATAESPLPEMLGDGGIYINPNKANELEEAIKRVLDSTEQRTKMREAGIAATGALSWDEAARQMMSIMGEVVSG
jgi:glycosyltransferase involved in cell wall biosynthesis